MRCDLSYMRLHLFYTQKYFLLNFIRICDIIIPNDCRKYWFVSVKYDKLYLERYMDKKIDKIIDFLVWPIPFRNMRDKTRKKLKDIQSSI